LWYNKSLFAIFMKEYSYLYIITQFLFFVLQEKKQRKT